MMPYKIPIINVLRKFKVISLSLLIVGGLIGCHNSTNLGFEFTVSKIALVKESNDTNSQIYLEGKVIKTAKFLDGGAYLLEDGTDEIWVYTQEELPMPGNSILIQGQLKFQSILTEDEELRQVGDFHVVELKQIELDKTP